MEASPVIWGRPLECPASNRRAPELTVLERTTIIHALRFWRAPGSRGKPTTVDLQGCECGVRGSGFGLATLRGFTHTENL